MLWSFFAKKFEGQNTRSTVHSVSAPCAACLQMLLKGFKEGTQALQGLRGTDSGTLDNTLLWVGRAAPVGLLGHMQT